MDTLSLPFGLNAGHMEVSEDVWMNGPAVSFQLPDDDRLIAREHIPGLIAWLQEFYEETKAEPPGNLGAIVRAEVRGHGTVVLSLADLSDSQPWRPVDYSGSHRRTWFSSDEFESFEVLFPGVES